MTYMQSTDGYTFETDSPQYHKECRKLTKAEGEQAMRAQALANLHKVLKPGDRVYCVLRHVSSSGMSRRISFYAMTPDGPQMLDGWIESLGIGSRSRKHDGVTVGGCGMDMGFHVVYSLGSRMWPNGTPAPHGSRNGQPDTDGGYALKSEWL